ncbi:MAG: hypothetical protein IJ617_04495 [Oscillospiraceae bacterium]|nr:hypothetical protein [Oscillospiraceae bacterium]
MDEFEAALNRVLSDPAEMEKITRLAGQLMGGEGEAKGGGGMPGPGALGQLMGGGGGGGDKSALVKALMPYLRPERREKLKKALAMAQAAKVARLAMGQFGGGENV